jgi:hypothetical protein
MRISDMNMTSGVIFGTTLNKGLSSHDEKADDCG